MLDRLPESRRPRSRPVATFAVAVGVHALLAAAAVRAAVPPAQPALVGPVLILDPYRAPAPERQPAVVTGGGEAVGAAPVLPLLPVLGVPDGIPPIASIGAAPIPGEVPGGRLGLADLLGPAIPVSDVVDATADGVVPPRFLDVGPSPLAGSGVHGRVTLQFVVDTVGQVEGPSLAIVAAPDSTLAAAARRTVLGARFEPGRSGGRRVRTLVRQTVTFDP